MNKLWTGLAVLALLILAGGAYLYLLQPSTPVSGAPAPVVAETATVPPAPQAPTQPSILHPLQAAGEPAASAPSPDRVPLPVLAEADAFVKDALTGLLGRRAVLQMLQLDGFVQRIVATVDNLPRKHASPRLWPVHPMAGRFATLERSGRLQVDPDNAGRYLPLVQLIESVEPGQAAALYRRLYPLFQQAYEELGYPKAYFNDRLVEVIDHLQATPQVDGPLEVVLTEVKGPYPSTTPWLNHEFADPALQSLSAGQRALLRSGVVSQRRLLAWLAAFRAQVTQ